MIQRELAMLKRALSAEIAAAKHKGPHLLQTKSKLADTLVEDGMLAKRTMVLQGWMPVTINGYELTRAGRHACCESRKDIDENVSE